ncbi:MAG: type II toxin-antitoxin system VapC family toxin [Isosphaeraceae bacterium]
MKALLDTCVLTEIGKDDGNRTVKSAVAEIASSNLYLSVLTVGEIARGIALLHAGRKKTLLGTWLARMENQYADRILVIDVETSRIWGELTARAQKRGVTIPGTDGLLAATALRHGLHVVTRNTRHFEASGALIIDPWKAF